MSVILAIDLGGTRCRVGVAEAAEPASVQLLEDIPAPRSLPDFLGLLKVRIASVGATALGLGIPGLATGSICRWVPNLPFLDGIDLADELPEVVIGLGNDAQFSLLAEAHCGAASGLSDAILLAIGTGIGSSVMTSRTIVAGQGGGACSFGWATADLEDQGEEISGWLERQAAGRAFDKLGRGLHLEDGQALIAAARAGDAAALAALEWPIQALAAAIGSAVALLDPSAVIIAGGVTGAFDVIEPTLRTAIDRRLPPHLRGVPILRAQHGAGAGLVGAAFAGATGPNWRTIA